MRIIQHPNLQLNDKCVNILSHVYHSVMVNKRLLQNIRRLVVSKKQKVDESFMRVRSGLALISTVPMVIGRRPPLPVFKENCSDRSRDGRSFRLWQAAEGGDKQVTLGELVRLLTAEFGGAMKTVTQ